MVGIDLHADPDRVAANCGPVPTAKKSAHPQPPRPVDRTVQFRSKPPDCEAGPIRRYVEQTTVIAAQCRARWQVRAALEVDSASLKATRDIETEEDPRRTTVLR